MSTPVTPFEKWGDPAAEGNENSRPRGVFPGIFWEPLGEEFRSLRTRVVRSLGDEKNKVILVTSAVPREGKTMVAVNLARAMAEASWKTLLVDGDMRASAVHSLFGLEKCEGLSDILHLERFVPEFIIGSDIPELDILTAGTHISKSAELLNKQIAHFVNQELRHRYQYVIIDSAPVVPVTDALLLARHADGILLVVESQKTPREEVRKTVEQFKDRPVLGLVMNGVDHQSKYSYYSY